MNGGLASTYYFFRRDFGVAWERTKHTKFNTFLIPDLQVGFSFRHTGSQIWVHVCYAENRIARTKNAVNLLGLAPWKNAQLLGISNVISFLLAASHWNAVWVVEKIGD